MRLYAALPEYTGRPIPSCLPLLYPSITCPCAVLTYKHVRLLPQAEKERKAADAKKEATRMEVVATRKKVLDESTKVDSGESGVRGPAGWKERSCGEDCPMIFHSINGEGKRQWSTWEKRNICMGKKVGGCGI